MNKILSCERILVFIAPCQYWHVFEKANNNNKKNFIKMAKNGFSKRSMYIHNAGPKMEVGGKILYVEYSLRDCSQILQNFTIDSAKSAGT